MPQMIAAHITRLLIQNRGFGASRTTGSSSDLTVIGSECGDSGAGFTDGSADSVEAKWVKPAKPLAAADCG